MVGGVGGGVSRAGPTRREQDWEWVQGDSLDRASIVDSAKVTDAIVRAVKCFRLSKLESAGLAD
jgi:hypothetical protein